jgi:hypothetical protein
MEGAGGQQSRSARKPLSRHYLNETPTLTDESTSIHSSGLGPQCLKVGLPPSIEQPNLDN